LQPQQIAGYNKVSQTISEILKPLSRPE